MSITTEVRRMHSPSHPGEILRDLHMRLLRVTRCGTSDNQAHRSCVPEEGTRRRGSQTSLRVVFCSAAAARRFDDCAHAVTRITTMNVIRTCLLGLAALAGCVSQQASHTGNTVPSAPNKDAVSAVSANAAAANKQVIAAEQAFAKTMADRNFKSFVTFLSPDAVFFSGNEVAHGAAAVAAKWEPYFSGREAPFSWAPDHVEVLASGDLALSTGYVYQNHKVVGRFNSIWRLESPNSWRIVFDKGEAVCEIAP
jgi:ketosteroid isomerase-like protein